MLVLSQNARATFDRPKYHRRLQHKQWVVLESGKTSSVRVFGPDDHAACIRYMSDNTKRENEQWLST